MASVQGLNGRYRAMMEASHENLIANLTVCFLRYHTYEKKLMCTPAGWTYCGVSTLALLDKLPSVGNKTEPNSASTHVSQAFTQDLLHWLVWRQTNLLSDYQDLDGMSDSEESGSDSEQEFKNDRQNETAFAALGSPLALPPHILDFEAIPSQSDKPIIAGFNGRCNKPADTCYSFWACASLAVSLIFCLFKLKAEFQ
jgi:geranylgeranyl transferase type-1 subunit beta